MREDIYDMEETIVTITLDDDTEIQCVVLSTFEAGGRDYIAVLPEPENEEGDEDSEVYLYRFEMDSEGQPILSNIESDEEYELVADAFDEILDEEEFFELYDEDDEEL